MLGGFTISIYLYVGWCYFIVFVFSVSKYVLNLQGTHGETVPPLLALQSKVGHVTGAPHHLFFGKKGGDP